MGWYDAYKPTNVSRVNVANMSSDTGNAAKGLGDAFTSIGDSMLKVDKARSDEKKSDAQTALLNSQAKLSKSKKTNIDNINGAFDETNNLKNKSIKADTDYKTANTGLVTKKVNAFDETNHLKNESIKADTAYKTANTGLVTKKADVFDDNNKNTQDNIKAKTAYTEKQTEDYDKTLDIKSASKDKTLQKNNSIARQVKTAMGLDNSIKPMTQAQKTEYEDATMGATVLAKKYNLSPSEAIVYYRDRNKYDFTGDKIKLKQKDNLSQTFKKGDWIKFEK